MLVKIFWPTGEVQTHVMTGESLLDGAQWVIDTFRATRGDLSFTSSVTKIEEAAC